MAIDPDAELLAALDAVTQFIEQTIANTEGLAEALRADRRPSDTQFQAIEEQLAADRRELERLRLRVAQIKAQQRTH